MDPLFQVDPARLRLQPGPGGLVAGAPNGPGDELETCSGWPRVERENQRGGVDDDESAHLRGITRTDTTD